VNLVVETDEGAASSGSGRRTESHSWLDGDFTGDPDAAAAATWLQQHYWAT